MTIIVRSRADDFRQARDVAIMVDQPNGDRVLVQPFVLKVIDPADTISPTISGRFFDGTEFLQAVLNHAWEIGLRPVGFLDTTNETAALKAHLSDMRRLVFDPVPEHVHSENIRYVVNEGACGAARSSGE